MADVLGQGRSPVMGAAGARPGRNPAKVPAGVRPDHNPAKVREGVRPDHNRGKAPAGVRPRRNPAKVREGVRPDHNPAKVLVGVRQGNQAAVDALRDHRPVMAAEGVTAVAATAAATNSNHTVSRNPSPASGNGAPLRRQ